MKVRTFITTISLLFCLLGTAIAEPITVGVEINLTNQKLRKSWENYPLPKSGGRPPGVHEQKAVENLKDAILRKCQPECEVTSKVGKFKHTEYQFKFADGWGFNLSTDPACVEIQTFPATTAELKSNAPRLQNYLFDTAAEIGLHPKPVNSQDLPMHLNFGVKSAFEDSPKSFVHFVADYSNRPSLAMGGFGWDEKNAPPLLHLKPEQIESFNDLVGIANKNKKATLKDLGQYLNYKVYTNSPQEISRTAGRHYQAIGAKNMIESEFSIQDVPMELRAIRQPKDAEGVALLGELFEKRIQYIKTLNGEPIYFRKMQKSELLAKAVPRGNPTAVAIDLEIFFKEIGEDWRKYSSLLTPSIAKIMKDGDARDFLKGKLRWNLKKDVQIFQECVLERFYYSPWMRNHVAELIDSGTLPVESLTTMMKALHDEAAAQPEHLKQLEGFTQSLKNENILQARRSGLFGPPIGCGISRWLKALLR